MLSTTIYGDTINCILNASINSVKRKWQETKNEEKITEQKNSCKSNKTLQ